MSHSHGTRSLTRQVNATCGQIATWDFSKCECRVAVRKNEFPFGIVSEKSGDTFEGLQSNMFDHLANSLPLHDEKKSLFGVFHECEFVMR